MAYNEPYRKDIMFDPNADPEAVAARAAELSLEQLERLRHYLRYHDLDQGPEFLREPFEIMQSNQIAKLMAGYAVLKGYVTEEQANR